MDKLTTIAVDIAKRVFSVYWVEAQMGEIGARTMSRADLEEFLSTREPSRVVLEASGIRMKDRFALLAGARGAAARQATLKAAIDWSWDLLVPWEKAALAQCSTFDGGFTLEAAEAVVSLGAWPEAPAVFDAIQALVDKSLLHAWQTRSAGRLDIAEPFFGMYLSIHEYAGQKLREFGEQAVMDTEQRHGCYFAGFGSERERDALLSHGCVARRQTLAQELDNLISACRRAVRRRQPEIAAACLLAAWAVLEAQGPFGLATTTLATVFIYMTNAMSDDVSLLFSLIYLLLLASMPIWLFVAETVVIREELGSNWLAATGWTLAGVAALVIATLILIRVIEPLINIVINLLPS